MKPNADNLMNPDTTTTAGKIAVMQAHERAEKLEFRHHTSAEWSNLEETPSWTWGEYHYRIKPKPREWWINVETGGNRWIHPTRESAESFTSPKLIECIHVREVTP